MQVRSGGKLILISLVEALIAASKSKYPRELKQFCTSARDESGSYRSGSIGRNFQF